MWRFPDRPCWSGNSYGCQVAAELATRRATSLAGMVLVGPTVDPSARTWHQQLGRWFRDLPHEPLALAPVLWRDAREAGAQRLWTTFQDGLRHDVEVAVAGIPVPVLVVRGEHDTIAPHGWCRRLRDAAPRGALTTVPGAGHVANFSHPKVLGQCVDDLLADRPG